MRIYQEIISKTEDQCGATAILVALVMIPLLGFTALSVDIGYGLATKNELQNIADATALAATRQLGAIYETMTYEEQQTYVCEGATIVSIVQELASKNRAAGMNIVINDTDVIIGRWDGSSYSLQPTLAQPDAVRVLARRDGGSNGPIMTFFARIFGIDNINVSAFATAALTGQSTAGPGGLDLPVGISKKWFERPEFCNQPIQFSPTGTLEGCAGWSTFDSWPANSSKLRNILEGMTDGTITSPQTVVGETSFAFIGGDVASAFEEMQALYDANKDPDTGFWEVLVPVYESDDCSNPTGSVAIIGFATAIITAVEGPPSKTIQAQVICENIEPGRGSGGDYGTMGSIPGLVE